MSQLDIFSNQIPSNVTDAIAWSASNQIDDYRFLYISFKMESPIFIGGLSLIQWLKSFTTIQNFGFDEDKNIVVKFSSYPDWLVAEVKKYRSPLGGSSHPVNRVRWNH